MSNGQNTNGNNAPANTTNDGARLVLTQTPVTAAAAITVNVGVPGNIKKLVLEGDKNWTVGQVLKNAGFDSSGYEIRMGGEPVNEQTPVTDGRTILLLRPVVGNN